MTDFDPNRSLPVRWEDVIAARNAVGALRSVIATLGDDPQVMSMAGFGLTAGLPDHARDMAAATPQESAQWLYDLLGRLNSALPLPDEQPSANTVR